MAISYPSSLDTLNNPSSSDPLNSPAHASQHADINDAVEALETKLGADGAPITMTTTTMLFGTTNQLQFRDTAIHIESADDGHLDLTADTSIDLNGAIVIGGNVTAGDYDITINTDAFVLNAGTKTLWIGDTANANMTTGLTINQAGYDDEILAFKSSDIAHGITDYAETDTYANFKKANATAGGLWITGYSSVTRGLTLYSMATTPDTTKSTAADGGLLISAATKSGTGVTALGSNGNIAVFRNYTSARFILDADGDSHQDVGTAWTNFDEHDDIELLNALSGELTRYDDPLKESFGKWIGKCKDALEKNKIVTFNEDGHHFINWSRTHMLEIGAIRQLAEKINLVENKLKLLEA